MASKKRSREGGLVWDSEVGQVCPGCGAVPSDCTCAVTDEIAEGDGIVRVSLDRKGRKGKSATLVSGIPLPAAGLKALAKELKQRCATGGSVKDGVIEIQGDQRDVLVAELQKRGYLVKRAGG